MALHSGSTDTPGKDRERTAGELLAASRVSPRKRILLLAGVARPGLDIIAELQRESPADSYFRDQVPRLFDTLVCYAELAEGPASRTSHQPIIDVWGLAKEALVADQDFESASFCRDFQDAVRDITR